MTRLDRIRPDAPVAPALRRGDARPHAVVIGAGLGGLAGAMRLGARGYRVTVIDKLDAPIVKVDKVMTEAEDAVKAIKTAADSFAVAAKNISSGDGLLGALINDKRLKADFHDLIYNLKVNGPVIYRNTADKERARLEEEKEKEVETPRRKSLFGN